MSETGSAKFQCRQIAATLSQFPQFDELNRYRNKLLDLGMVGVDANDVSFGNLSVRDGATAQFYITATGAGGLAELALTDLAKVITYDFATNSLQCEGSRMASSESLTHAAVFESDSTARAVIHCHDDKLWSALLSKVSATPDDVEYGTPEMAYAVKRLFHTTAVRDQRILVMSGHPGGLIAFGRDLGEAFTVLMQRRAC